MDADRGQDSPRGFVRRESGRLVHGLLAVAVLVCACGGGDFSDADGVTTSIEASKTPMSGLPGIGRIAFQSNRASSPAGSFDIWMMDTDGSNTVQITTHPANDECPVWSPDGTRIAFSTTRNSDSTDEPRWDIYVVEIGQTMAPEQVATGVNAAAWDWSPDGRQLLFFSDAGGSKDIYVMDADGSNTQPLTFDPAWDADAEWSPDGSKIAFASDRTGGWEIFVMDSDGSNVIQLTQAEWNDTAPTWSPDGSQIAYLNDRHIYKMAADGSNPTRLTEHIGSGFPTRPVWSPDGTRIAFAAAFDDNDDPYDGNVDIYVMNSDGSELTRLTEHPAVDACPAWAPET